MKGFFHLLNRLLSILYKVFPFFAGMYCYYPVFVEQGRAFPFLDAIYSSVKLYSGAIESGVEAGALLQITRFLEIGRAHV